MTDKIDDRLLTFCNYSFLRLDRNYVNSFNTTKKGGGILVYFKKELEPYVKDIENNAMTRHSEELWVTFKKPGGKVLTLGIVYRPLSGDVPTFIKSLDHNLSDILGKGNPYEKELFLMGDFNIDYSRGNDLNKQALKITKYNMCQLIKTPTLSTLTTKSVIDLIFTTIKVELIVESGPVDVIISDHLPVYMVRKKRREKHTTKTCYYSHFQAIYQGELCKYNTRRPTLV